MEQMDPEGSNRVILATDEYFNVGQAARPNWYDD